MSDGDAAADPDRGYEPAPDLISEQIKAFNAGLIRRAAWALVATAVAVIVICTVLRGWTGFVGSVLGVLLVVLFFGADVVALRLTRRSKPATIVAVIIFLYLTKLLLVLLALQGLRVAVTFDAASFTAAVIVGALAAGIAALRLWSTMHVAIVDP